MQPTLPNGDLARVLTELQRVLATAQPPAAAATFSTAYLEFVRARELRPSTARSILYELNGVFLPFFGDGPVHAIDSATIARFVAARRQAGVARRTLRKQVTELRAFFRWAIRAGYTARDPTEGIRHPVHRGADEAGRALSVQEARALMRTCAHPTLTRASDRRRPEGWLQHGPSRERLRMALHIALQTGLRRGNLFGLRWEQVDLVGSRITIPGTEMKAHRAFSIPLHRELRQALADRRLAAGLRTPYVLGSHVQDLDGSFHRALADAGCPRIRWHDLRHTFATWLAPRVPFPTLQALLGHAPANVTFRYLHIGWEDLIQAIGSLPSLVEESDQCEQTSGS